MDGFANSTGADTTEIISFSDYWAFATLKHLQNLSQFQATAAEGPKI